MDSSQPSSPALPWSLGVRLPEGASAEGGTRYDARAAVFAPRAEAVEVCLFEGEGQQVRETRRVRLTAKTNGTFQGVVPDVPVGQLYGLRVHGEWDPGAGLRFNPEKVLLDPYAQAVCGEIVWGQPLYGHSVDDQWRPVDGDAQVGGARVIDTSDSLGSVPLGVLLPPMSPARPGPGTRWEDTVIYEAHLKGLTKLHPDIPEELRGTWAGLAHPAAIEHLTSLGVSAVELLPVFAHGDEPHLVRQGLSNYWGYNHLSFFAPEPAYATAAARAEGPEAVVAEIVSSIDRLHQAGLEVILDVVYNHTCEGGSAGPTFCWRGLGEKDYYRMDDHGRIIDYTGTGNTLDFSQQAVVQLTLDSLRHWVTRYGVDGFRFDLAPVLARGNGRVGRENYEPDHPFLVALRSDPVLSRVKLIAEPWDVGPSGWRTGEFPTPFAEWNDRYRDAIRGFWAADRGVLRMPFGGHPRTDLPQLATRLAGSSDYFHTSAAADHLHRPAWSTINFVTAHDGFCLNDLVSYDHKHNEDNGEDNRDGTNNNLSWNHGFEGRTNRIDILSDRHRTQMAILSTLLLSIGTPMLLGGDELGRTQGGNNNAYCQDNDISWLQWQWPDERRTVRPIGDGLLEGMRELLRLRARYPALRPTLRPDGRPVTADGRTDIGWFAPDGSRMEQAHWHDSSLRTLQMALHGEGEGSQTILVVVHGSDRPIHITLPGKPWAAAWSKEWDSAAFANFTWETGPDLQRPVIQGGCQVVLTGSTVALFVEQPAC